MVKKIIKWVWYTFVIVAIALILIRVFMSTSSNVLNTITATSEASDAYLNGGEILTHRMSQSISDDGIMRCYALVYIPEAKQVQITIKFNKSIFNNVKESEQFGFKLYNTGTETLVEEVRIDRADKGLYKYCRVVFNDVELNEGEALEIIMTNAEHTEEYSVYQIHADNMKFKEYKLSRSEKKILGGEK